MQKINPLQTLVRARLANIDLNQEVDALIEAMRASFSAPAALLEPVDTLDGQLNAHLELRQGLVTRLAWLPSHQQTLEQHAALIKDSLASYCLLGVKVDLKGATALTQLPTQHSRVSYPCLLSGNTFEGHPTRLSSHSAYRRAVIQTE